MNEKDDATLYDATLHALAGKLGERAAARLDVEATTQTVLERLRREPAEPANRWTWAQPAWLRVAAAVVLLAGGALVGRRVLTGPRAVGHDVAHYVTDDLTDLSADQLREVLGTLDETLDLGRTAVPEADLENLDARQLRAVLRSLEG